MTSEPQQAFVWIWLPGAADPVVAGRLDAAGELVTFTYPRLNTLAVQREHGTNEMIDALRDYLLQSARAGI
jgi:hypothetical protein